MDQETPSILQTQQINSVADYGINPTNDFEKGMLNSFFESKLTKEQVIKQFETYNKLKQPVQQQVQQPVQPPKQEVKQADRMQEINIINFRNQLHDVANGSAYGKRLVENIPEIQKKQDISDAELLNMYVTMGIDKTLKLLDNASKSLLPTSPIGNGNSISPNNESEGNMFAILDKLNSRYDATKFKETKEFRDIKRNFVAEPKTKEQLQNNIKYYCVEGLSNNLEKNEIIDMINQQL